LAADGEGVWADWGTRGFARKNNQLRGLAGRNINPISKPAQAIPGCAIKGSALVGGPSACRFNKEDMPCELST
jgi:hypothetical protein